MTTFDILGFLKYLKTQSDVYMDLMEKKLTEQNPTFIEDLRKNRDLFNEDGTIKSDIKEETIVQYIATLRANKSFTDYQYDENTVKELFTVNDDVLKRFTITT